MIGPGSDKNTIRDGGNTTLQAAYIVDTLDMVYSVDMVYPVDIVYTVDMIYLIFVVYTIQTALHCLNISIYAYIYR